MPPLGHEPFFHLTNMVLKESGRTELPPDSPHRDIIAVRDDDCVLQILAGPGSGKTEMLVWRVLYDLYVRGTPSDAVMVTTFTRRAATELNVRVVERCDQLLHFAKAAGYAAADPQVHNLRIGTIHSLCDGLLAEFDTEYMAAGTQLIDEPECVARIVRAQRLDLGYNPAGPPGAIDRLLACPPLVALFRATWETKWPWPSSQMDRVAFLMGVLNQQVETWFPRCGATGAANGIEVRHGPKGLTVDLRKLQQRWEEYLDKNQVLDFATVQKRFLKVQPALREKLLHVFVDEFQDNNPIQFAIHTGWLANPRMRLTVVGDDDQALYRFRGSDLACFADLGPHCHRRKIPYRQAKLEENHRSTRAVIAFTQAFRTASVLHKTSMMKTVRPPAGATAGASVRLLRGSWDSLCELVARELSKAGCGQPKKPGKPTPPTGAVLMFSTSERSDQSPALAMRSALGKAGVVAYNPRNKTAADKGSPVYELLGLISYLIDPVSKAPVGKRGGLVEVAASMNDSAKASAARSDLPGADTGARFRISEAHLKYQKGFIKSDGEIANPGPATRLFLNYLDQLRDRLAQATEAHRADPSKPPPRLTLAGLVARLLSFDRYRDSGFSESLFRQALFTELLESHTAPTRRSMDPLDHPLEVVRAGVKYVWPARYWNFLNVFGSYLNNASIDDPEVEAFEEDAVLLLTFHQSKGLEFDHVYVAGTGRPVDMSPVLRTKLFSGDAVSYSVDSATGAVTCKDSDVNRLALADREREVYVGLTRAKKHLTVLFDPSHEREFLTLNPEIEKLFARAAVKAYPRFTDVDVLEYSL
jgi:DNA helicase-2/ATP-dependent DNA helicase PcrA